MADTTRTDGPAGAMPGKVRRPVFAVFAAVFVACLVSACASLPFARPAPDAAATQAPAAPAAQPPQADPQEVAIAEAEHPRILAAYGGTYADARVEQEVGRTVARLVAASTEPWRSYRVTILNSPVVNAFALPGGYVYVTRGLLALANDSSELAAVIAHEMAHVTQRHAFARAKRIEAVQMAGQVVDQVLHDPDAAKTVMASSERSLASFSQAQELEADQIGIQTLAKAGYDPFGAARFLHAMATFNAWRTRGQDAGSASADFLSTHPSTPEREQLANAEAQRLNVKTGEQGADTFLDAVNGLLYGDDPAQGYVRNRQFMHARLGLAFQVPDNFSLENTSRSVLATDRSGIAMRFDGTSIPDGSDLVSYLESGWMAGVDEGSIRTTSVNGLPAVTARATNRGFEYRVCILRFGPGVYRFLFAARRDGPELDQAFAATIASFRPLTPPEAQALHPLRVKVVAVAAGDTLAALAQKMAAWSDGGEGLLRALNDLGPGQEPAPGARIKVLADGG